MGEYYQDTAGPSHISEVLSNLIRKMFETRLQTTEFVNLAFTESRVFDIPQEIMYGKKVSGESGSKKEEFTLNNLARHAKEIVRLFQLLDKLNETDSSRSVFTPQVLP